MGNDKEVKVPIFDGKDYNLWKKRILVYLKSKHCDEVVSRAREATDKEWDDHELKAMNILYCSISNEQLQFVLGEDTARKILAKFDSIYSKSSTSLQIVIRNKLDRLKLKDFENSVTFSNEFERLINELKNGGASIDETEKFSYMLKTLPDSLSYLGDLLDVLKKDERTCSFIKSKIEMCETRHSQETNSKSSLFKVEKKNIECFNCHKKGHMKRDCQANNVSFFSGRGNWRGNLNSRGNWRGGSFGRGHWQERDHQQQQQRSSFNGRGFYNGRRGFGHRGGQRGYHQQYGYHHDARNVYSERYDNNFNGSGEQASTFFFKFENDKMLENRVNLVNKQNHMYNVNQNQTNYPHFEKIEWILDSGCTDHVINDDSYFSDYTFLQNPIDVSIADGTKLKCDKVGNIITTFVERNLKTEIKMSNVFYMKDLDRNLISLSKITNNPNYKVLSYGNKSEIYNGYDQRICTAYKENGLYKISSFAQKNTICVNSSVKMTKKEKLHRTLGHVNFNYLDRLCKYKLIEGSPKNLESDYFKCAICIKNKMHNIPFENNRTRATEILQLVHTDLNGPHRNTGYDGSKYFLTFIDDFSKCTLIFTIKNKSEVYRCFLEYINLVANLTGKKIKKLRCDNGREYINNDVTNLIREKGIYIEPCPPYVKQLNGTAERYNRSIMDTARCLMSESKLHICYWPEAVKTAAYLKNRTIANTILNKTPFEIFFDQKPSMKYLKLYGSKIFVKTPEEKRDSKWNNKAELGILVGYDNVGYRVLIGHRVIIARHVDIVEDDVKLIGLDSDSESDTESTKSFQSSDDEVFEDCKVHKNESENRKFKKSSSKSYSDSEINEERRKSTRERKAPERYGNPVTNFVYINYVSADAPKSYVDAIESRESDLWSDAMKQEIECIEKNKTWKLVDKPKNKKALDLKWVYTNKLDGRKKARLVVRGYQQDETIDDIYSPVARMQTLKLLLAHCNQHKYFIDQMDVESAFLNGRVKSEVYVKQPVGYSDRSDKVLKLEKALYGLRESPRAWYECLDEYLKS